MESNGFVAIVIAAVAVLIGLAFYSGSVSPSIGQMTQTSYSNGTTMALPNENATSEMTMCGQRAISVILTNATSGAVLTTTNYTISQSPGTDGHLAAKVTTGVQVSAYAERNVNVSCTYEPKGYISESSGRGMVVLIGIFSALLIVIAALPNVRNGLLNMIKGA